MFCTLEKWREYEDREIKREGVMVAKKNVGSQEKCRRGAAHERNEMETAKEGRVMSSEMKLFLLVDQSVSKVWKRNGSH